MRQYGCVCVDLTVVPSRREERRREGSRVKRLLFWWKLRTPIRNSQFVDRVPLPHTSHATPQAAVARVGEYSSRSSRSSLVPLTRQECMPAPIKQERMLCGSLAVAGKTGWCRRDLRIVHPASAGRIAPSSRSARVTLVVPLLRLPDVAAYYTQLPRSHPGAVITPRRSCSPRETSSYLPLLRWRLGEPGASVAVYPSTVRRCDSSVILHGQRLWKGRLQSLCSAASSYEVCGSAAFLG